MGIGGRNVTGSTTYSSRSTAASKSTRTTSGKSANETAGLLKLVVGEAHSSRRGSSSLQDDLDLQTAPGSDPVGDNEFDLLGAASSLGNTLFDNDDPSDVVTSSSRNKKKKIKSTLPHSQLGINANRAVSLMETDIDGSSMDELL